MFVNKIAFFMTISQNLRLVPAKMIVNRKVKSLLCHKKADISTLQKGNQIHALSWTTKKNTAGALAKMKIT
jgi:hypothetical protein